MIEQMASSDETMSGDKKPPGLINEGSNRIHDWPLGKRVMIVDDETLVALHLESVLQELGLEVCDIVSTGKEAIQVALSAQPDIIFMDVNLADGIDGVEAARQILVQREFPIVFVTAYVDHKPTIFKINSTIGQSIVVGKPASPAAIQAALSQIRKR